MSENSIPGWKTYIDEISNGVFKVLLIDAYARMAEIIDNATEETIERTISDAFDIEKQISKNWNLFLYNLALEKLTHDKIINKDFNDEEFGSWFIERKNKRLIYNGKDSRLLLQTKINDNWTDIEIIKKDNLNYSHYIKQINFLTEKHYT